MASGLLVSGLGCSAGGGGGSGGGGGNSAGAGANAGGAGTGGVPGGGGTGGVVIVDVPGGAAGSAGMENCDATLEVIYRDFTPETHPDFESFNGWNEVGCEIVMPTLGADYKPVFQSARGTGKRVLTANNVFAGECTPWGSYDNPPLVVTSAESFDQWYRTIEGVNVEIPGTLPLVETSPGSGKFVYDSSAFFPINGQGFDVSKTTNNYHFTTEAHVKFGYQPGHGQTFTFRGDDDLWIFVNGKLAIDLGGLHMPIEQTLDFDAQASKLGISRGGTFQMDIFHAERHRELSNFRVETNISCFETVDIIIR